MKSANTSWSGVADWYDDLIKNPKGNYQSDLILPNLVRLMDIKKGEKVLDLACGQGFFSFEFAKIGGETVGVDISKELIELAKQKQTSDNKHSTAKSKLDFVVGPADKLDFITDKSIDKIVIVLAIQNIENLNGVVKECARILKGGAKLFIVMNHPVFRIPKVTSWGWDEQAKKQYRRIDAYMSESRQNIDMHPGEKKKDYTVSFHRPLQVYFKAFAKNGLAVSRLEEWVSNKKSEPGSRAEAENAIRKEIPLFLALEVIKLS